MSNFKLHVRAFLLQIAKLLRLCLLAAGIAYGLYRIALLLNAEMTTEEWLSKSMLGEYAIIVGIIVAIIVLRALKRELQSRLDTVQFQIKQIQDERVAQARRKLMQQQLKRELQEKHGHKINSQDPIPDYEESNIRKFNVQKTASNPKEELASLIGMDSVKEQVEKIEAKLNYEKAMKNHCDNNSLHMRFVGGPGTGKTSVGRIMAGLLYQMKQIPKNKYVEINGNDLVGRYMGETPLVVKSAFQQAAGGVLFIDEVYALARGAQHSGGGGYGDEAVTQLLTLLENNSDGTVVIVAGYRDQMDQFFRMNPGLPSRIPTVLEFPDYAPLELLKIAELMLKDLGHSLTKEAAMKIFDVIQAKINRSQILQKPFGNARYIRNVVAELHQEHALNYQKGLVSDSNICLSDIKEDRLLKLD